MIMSVSTLSIGSGAATPVSFVNLSIAWLVSAFHILKAVGECAEIALGRGQSVYVGRLAAGNHGLVQLPRPKQLQSPFNACELAPVKVMLQRADHRLDVAADAPELAHRLLARAAVVRRPFQQAQRLAGSLQGGGDLFGICGDPARGASHPATDSEFSQQCTVSAMERRQRA